VRKNFCSSVSTTTTRYAGTQHGQVFGRADILPSFLDIQTHAHAFPSPTIGSCLARLVFSNFLIGCNECQLLDSLSGATQEQRTNESRVVCTGVFLFLSKWSAYLQAYVYTRGTEEVTSGFCRRTKSVSFAGEVRSLDVSILFDFHAPLRRVRPILTGDYTTVSTNSVSYVSP
jgi:hypothetical protein